MCVQDFGGETSRKNHLEDLGLHGQILLKWIFKRNI